MQRLIAQLASGIAVSSLCVSIAMAQNHSVKVTLNCPDIANKRSEVITNYGTYIAGTGFERINSDAATRPLFQGQTAQGANIPIDLQTNGYSNNGVSYNPAVGTVTCYYKSSMGFDPFSISYLMVNAIGGYTVSSGSKEINMKLPIGVI